MAVPLLTKKIVKKRAKKFKRPHIDWKVSVKVLPPWTYQFCDEKGALAS